MSCLNLLYIGVSAVMANEIITKDHDMPLLYLGVSTTRANVRITEHHAMS